MHSSLPSRSLFAHPTHVTQHGDEGRAAPRAERAAPRRPSRGRQIEGLIQAGLSEEEARGHLARLAAGDVWGG